MKIEEPKQIQDDLNIRNEWVIAQIKSNVFNYLNAQMQNNLKEVLNKYSLDIESLSKVYVLDDVGQK